MEESLAYVSAKRHVEFYEEQSGVMQDHVEAMECYDCEDFLQLGIDACTWLTRAESRLREDVYEGERDDDSHIAALLDLLYERWLVPVTFAMSWSQRQINRGYIPKNFETFRKCVENVREISERRAWAFTVESGLADSEEW